MEPINFNQIKTAGIKLLGERSKTATTILDGHVIQRVKDKDAFAKVVTHPEGSPLGKLGITDSTCCDLGNGVRHIGFYKNPNHKFELSSGMAKYSSINRMFEGSPEEAKTFLGSLRTLVKNGFNIAKS